MPVVGKWEGRVKPAFMIVSLSHNVRVVVTRRVSSSLPGAGEGQGEGAPWIR